MARPIDYLLGNNIDKRTGLPMGALLVAILLICHLQ